MPMKRRHFLTLGSLSSLGIILRGRAVVGQKQPPSSKPAAKMPATIPATPASGLLLRFIATADAGSSDQNQAAVGQAMSRYHRDRPFKLALLAGDNIYNYGEIEKIPTAFEQPYTDLIKAGVEFRACLGNHDIITQNGDLQVQYPGFNMAGRYYTYRKDAVQFFVLDTNVNANWKTQRIWLETSLRQSDAPWKIVYGHHPAYSSGLYGTDRERIAQLAPLFKKYRVQLYINGHEHHYERTQPINGTTYLITGHGGAGLRPVGKSDWTAFADSRHGFSALEVYGDRLEIQGIGTDAQTFDRGIITL